VDHQHRNDNHHTINESFYCKRIKLDGLILVHNADHYLMAEYSDLTGVAKWQRVVLATQRDKIEQWLRQEFPVRSQPATIASPRKSKTALATPQVKIFNRGAVTALPRLPSEAKPLRGGISFPRT